MLTNDQTYILDLLRRAFGQPCEACEPDSEETAARMIRSNGILLTVYAGLNESLKAAMSKSYLAAMKQSILQGHEGKALLAGLAAEGFDCIGLKGWEMRRLYPKTGMRQMADLDILVRPYDFGRIRAFMASQGYGGASSESTWKHDGFRKGPVTVEMHKRLTDDSGAIRDWERGLWERAVPAEDGSRVFRMSPEDEFVFHFIHMHKDFMNGSLGLRRIVDAWLLGLSGAPGEAEAVLESLGLGEFSRRMLWLGRVVMGEEPVDERAETLLAHALTHGIYGTDTSYKAGRIASMSSGSLRAGKLRSAAAAVFLPPSRMKAQFPVLERRPWLLPWCWGKRIARFLRGDLERSRRRLDYSGISEEDYEEMRRFFEAGGVLEK